MPQMAPAMWAFLLLTTFVSTLFIMSNLSSKTPNNLNNPINLNISKKEMNWTW